MDFAIGTSTCVAAGFGRNRCPAALAVFCLLGCGGDSAVDRAALEDSGNPCHVGACEVVLEQVAVLSDSASPGILPDHTFLVERGRDGRFMAVSAFQDRIAVFDSVGTFLKECGNTGAGPGEFARISSVIVGADDSLFVYDRVQRKSTVFDPYCNVARVMPGMLYGPDMILANGSMVLARQVPTPSESGFPIHLLSRDGRISKSYGTDTAQHRLDLRWFTTRVVGWGSNGTIWSAAPGAYVLERWNPDTGDRITTIEVTSPWFRGVPGPHDNPFAPPDPFITTVFEDEEDRDVVWVLFQDRDADWQPPTPARAAEERRFDPEDYDGKYDWVLEAVSVRRGEVIGTKRFDSALWANPRNGLVTTRRPLDLHSGAYVRYDVWRATLTEREELP